LNGDVIRSRDFTFNLAINASTVKNEITKMPDVLPETISGTKKLAVGHSIYDYWLRTYVGVDPMDGSVVYQADNTSTTNGRRIWSNGKGGFDTLTTLISNAKFDYHGSAIPDVYGSFIPSFSFKGFTLNALLTFQYGGKTYDALYAALMTPANYGGARHVDILKRWQKPGDITGVPRMDAGRATDFNGQSSRWLVDASYLNIRTISLSYNLPRTLLTRLKLNSTQVFVSAENLAFFSSRKGMNNQQAFSGVTSNAYPPAQVISGGISLNF
jgi:hypothetical protein